MAYRVQNDLLDLGADLSVPPGEQQRERLRITPDYTEWVERACDELNATLAPLRSFVIPGGTPAAAHVHVCRTVCRRAERRALAVEDANPETVRYLNRLSDLLFIMARALNREARTRRPARAPSRCGHRARTGPRRPTSGVRPATPADGASAQLRRPTARPSGRTADRVTRVR